MCSSSVRVVEFLHVFAVFPMDASENIALQVDGAERRKQPGALSHCLKQVHRQAGQLVLSHWNLGLTCYFSIA